MVSSLKVGVQSLTRLVVGLILVSTLFLVPARAEDDLQTEVEEVTEVLPASKTFTYKTDDFQMNVSVPSNIGFSTSDIKEDNKLDVYFMPFSSLSGLFRVDIEAGIKVRLPLLALLFFVDIDTMILRKDRPDLFRFEWPILGISSQIMSLESGDIGVYSIAIPTKVGEGDLESLSVGEWNHIASYDLYAVVEPKLTAMGLETEDVTTGSVMEIERKVAELEEENEVESELVLLENYYRGLYEDLQKRYNSLLLNYTRLQDDLDDANLELSDTKSELDIMKLELEEKRSELNKASSKITVLQAVTLIAFVAGLSLMYIISKKVKVIP